MPDSLIGQGIALRVAEQTCELGVSGYGGVAFQIQGTFSGTLTFEASLASEWVPMRVTASNSSTAVTTATAPGVYIGSAVGFSSVRARMSTYGSGGAHVLIRADVASPGGSSSGGGAGSDVNLIEVGGVSIALGETTMSASLPVVIASDQSPIPITGSITASNPSVDATGATAPTDATYVGILDPSSGNLEGLVAERLDYDTGAGTSAQTILGLALPASGGPVGAIGGSGNVGTNVIRVVLATDQPTMSNTQPVSVASLPLPSGAATSALQTTGNTSVGSIDTKTPALGQALAAASVPVVLTAAQITTLTPPAAITGFATEATLSTLNGKVTAVNTGAVVLAAGTAFVGNVGTGQTPKVKTGSASATFTVVAAVTSKKVKVYSVSLMMVSATAVTVTFKDGASGTAIGTYLLQASASVTNGIAEAVSVPSTLFETSAGVLLEMSFSAAVSVTYNLRYFEEA